MKIPSLRLLLTAALLGVAMISTTTAKADCGGCGGKKESPSPAPSPSPAK